MKKLPIIPLLTLTISVITPVLNSVKTHALEIDGAGKTWWTISELLEYKTIVDEEEKVLCAGDINCLKSYREAKVAEDEKFSALALLQAFQLIPTELNFKTGTIKILLFDENMNARGSSREPQNGVTVNDLAIWIEKKSLTASLGTNKTKIRKILNNEVADIYPIFGFTSDNPIELERDREAEYRMLVDLDDLVEYRPRYIEYLTLTNYFGRSTIADFWDCSMAKNYPNGSCVLSVSAKNFRHTFVEAPEEPSSDDGAIEEPTEPEQPPQPEQPEEPGAPTKPEQPEIIEVPKTPTKTIPLSPNTGNFVSPCATKTIDFPWWLIGLIALGDAAIFWLFWPKPKNRQKSTKKVLIAPWDATRLFCKKFLQKSLDKKEKVR